jgi:hypothetical protein
MNWLLRDEQKELFDFLFASVVCLLFLGVTALFTWWIGKIGLTVRFAQGLGLLWLALGVTSLLLLAFHRLFRVDSYSAPHTYVISALVVSCFWQTCWSAFASNTINSFAIGTSWLVTGTMYLIGLVSCYVAFVDIQAFYRGQIYSLINAPLALLGFVVFSIWRGTARVMFGWILGWW